MPPKQAPKRLTKKEKRELALKLKQEEEERRRQQEEEERLQKEEEERKRRIEEERLAKEEEQRLLKENQDNQDWVQTMKKARMASEQENKVQEEWNKFTLSHTIADPEREAQITTFITQYKESPTVSNLQIQEALNYMQKSEELVEEIESFYLKYISLGDYAKSNKYLNFIREIRDITEQKLEECTSDLVKNSEKLADIKEEEVKKQQEEQTQGKAGKIDSKMFEVHQIYKLLNDFRYGLWINPNQKGGFRHKPIDFRETKMQMENPQKLLHQAFIMKACWSSYDNYSNPNKYYKNRVVGGVVNIECLERPPLQTKGGNWFLKYNYDVKESIKRLSNGTEGQGAQPVRIWYQLPDYLKLYKGKKPQIAVFDENTEEWRRDLITDISEISEDKVINFRTPKIGPCGLIQDRCTDYPYQHFFMRAVDDNKILVDIKGNRDTFKFEIGPGYAMLIPNPEIPEFDGFQGKKLPVGKLLNQLAKSGVNLLPIREDAITATLTPKNAVTEDLAIKDICQAIRSFMIRSSPFSFQLNEDKILCRIKENEEYDDQTFGEDQEKDWKSICWYPNKCAILRCGDKEEFPDERFKENTTAHINLEYLLKSHELSPEWVMKRMKDTEFVVTQDTLAQFLQLTHILTFTVFESEKKFEDDEEDEQQKKNGEEGDEQQQDGENQQVDGQEQNNNEGQQQDGDKQQQQNGNEQKQGENHDQQQQEQQQQQ